MSKTHPWLAAMVGTFILAATLTLLPASPATAQGTCTPDPSGACPTPTNTSPVLVVPTLSTSTPLSFAPPPTATPTPLGLVIPPPPEQNPYRGTPAVFAKFPPTNTPRPLLAPTMDPNIYNLEIYELEVTQGMQDLDNRMPLVERRGTVVRLYVRTEEPGKPIEIPMVYAWMRAIRNGQVLAPGPIMASNAPMSLYSTGLTPKELDTFLLKYQRSNPGQTFNFFVPNDWRTGTVTYEFQVFSVSPGWIQYEPIQSDNLYKETFTFYPAEPLVIVLAPVQMHSWTYNENDPDLVADDTYKIHTNTNMTYLSDLNAKRLAQSMLQHYPVNEVVIVDGPLVQPDKHSNSNHQNDWALEGSVNTWMINNNLQAQRDGNPWLNKNFWYGMVDPALPWWQYKLNTENPDLFKWFWYKFHYSGLSNGVVAFGKISAAPNATWPWYIPGSITLAHEGGHNYGLGHALCQGNEGSGGGLDENYPFPVTKKLPCSLAAIDPRGYYGYFWYWHLWPHLSGPMVISNDPAEPNAGFPVMGYKAPQWVDPYSYCHLLNVFGVSCDLASIGISGVPSGPATASIGGIFLPTDQDGIPLHLRDQPEYAIVMGGLNPETGAAQISRVARLLEPSEAMFDSAIRRQAALEHATEQGGTSPFWLALEDATGNVLFSLTLHNTTAEQGQGVGSGGEYGFYDLVPFPSGTAFVRVYHEETLAAERAVSASAPVVRLLPIRGEGGEVSVPLVVAWQAHDPDGDPLTFSLHYSHDGGATWRLVADALDVTSVQFESLDHLPGGEQALFRVIANDGVNTTADDSDVPFRLPDRAPRPMIFSPLPENVYSLRAMVMLTGQAYDLEDGPLSGTALVWTSDIDGVVGTGTQVETAALSAGTHIITLTATDSANNQTSMQTTVTIDEASALPLPPEGHAEAVSAIFEGTYNFEAAAAETTPEIRRTIPLPFILGGLIVAALGVVVFFVLRRRR